MILSVFAAAPFPAYLQQIVRFLPMLSCRQLYLHIVDRLGNSEWSNKNYFNMCRKNVILLETELKGSKTREEMISGGVWGRGNNEEQEKKTYLPM